MGASPLSPKRDVIWPDLVKVPCGLPSFSASRQQWPFPTWKEQSHYNCIKSFHPASSRWGCSYYYKSILYAEKLNREIRQLCLKQPKGWRLALRIWPQHLGSSVCYNVVMDRESRIKVGHLEGCRVRVSLKSPTPRTSGLLGMCSRDIHMNPTHTHQEGLAGVTWQLEAAGESSFSVSSFPHTAEQCQRSPHALLWLLGDSSCPISMKATLDEVLTVSASDLLWLASAFLCFCWAPAATCVHPQESRQTHPWWRCAMESINHHGRASKSLPVWHFIYLLFYKALGCCC